MPVPSSTYSPPAVVDLKLSPYFKAVDFPQFITETPIFLVSGLFNRPINSATSIFPFSVFIVAPTPSSIIVALLFIFLKLITGCPAVLFLVPNLSCEGERI